MENENTQHLRDGVQKLAIEAIKLIERRMRDDFGITFKTGMELEAFAIAKKPEKPKTSGLFGAASVGLYKLGLPTEKGKNIYNNRLRYLDNLIDYECSSPMIDTNSVEERLDSTPEENRRFHRFHVEAGDGRGYKQYEISTFAMAPIVTAEAIDGIKNMKSQGIEEHKLDDISFAPLKENSGKRRFANGLHVNISLWSGDRNLFGAMNGGQSDGFSDLLYYATSEEALRIHADSIFAIANSNASYIRHSFSDFQVSTGTGHGPTIRFKNTQEKLGGEIGEPVECIRGEKFARLENRLPDAESDPYLAALVTMAATYQGVKDNIVRNETGELEIKPHDKSEPKSLDHSKTLEAAESVFTDPENSFRILLDELSPQLGTNLIEAVTTYVHAKNSWVEKTVKALSQEQSVS